MGRRIRRCRLIISPLARTSPLREPHCFRDLWNERIWRCHDLGVCEDHICPVFSGWRWYFGDAAYCRATCCHMSGCPRAGTEGVPLLVSSHGARKQRPYQNNRGRYSGKWGGGRSGCRTASRCFSFEAGSCRRALQSPAKHWRLQSPILLVQHRWLPIATSNSHRNLQSPPAPSSSFDCSLNKRHRNLQQPSVQPPFQSVQCYFSSGSRTWCQ